MARRGGSPLGWRNNAACRDAAPLRATVTPLPGFEPPPAAWSAHHCFGSVDDLARALDGGSLDYLPLRGGAYETSITLVGMGDIVIQRIADQPRLIRGMIDPDRGGFAMAVEAIADHHQMNGRAVPVDEAHVFAAGSEIESPIPVALDWASLTLPDARFAALLDLAGIRHGPGEKGLGGLHLPPSAVIPLRNVVRAVTAQARAAPGMGHVAAMAPGLGDLLASAFAQAERDPPLPRALRQARRIHAEAIAWLDAHVAEPVYVDQLAQATGCSLRSLNNAFLAMTGMSPMAYLRCRRLMLVHAALRRAGPGRMLVKSIALGHGFWHLGRFGQQYRAMFGCTPQETQARAAMGRRSD